MPALFLALVVQGALFAPNPPPSTDAAAPWVVAGGAAAGAAVGVAAIVPLLLLSGTIGPLTAVALTVAGMLIASGTGAFFAELMYSSVEDATFVGVVAGSAAAVGLAAGAVGGGLLGIPIGGALGFYTGGEGGLFFVIVGAAIGATVGSVGVSAASAGVAHRSLEE